MELYEKSRVFIADGRQDVPRELPFVAPFNGKWAANLPGTTHAHFPARRGRMTSDCNTYFSDFGEEFGPTSWWTTIAPNH